MTALAHVHVERPDPLATYRDLIAARRIAFEPRGFTDVTDRDLLPSLFDHQKHGVDFALRTGCSGLFYDTGLGKTAMELNWADCVVRRTNRPVLMLTPLAVAQQHIGEAGRIGVEAIISREGEAPARPCIAVTNFERLKRFDPADYAAVVVDESSILKNFTGATSRRLIEAFAATRYRLEGSATPAPNDHTEIGTHAEFLGAMRRQEMLMRWFVHDSANTSEWRLKKHAVAAFWTWVASWARCVSRPSDLGFSDAGFEMPELHHHWHLVAADRSVDAGRDEDQARLFRMPDTSATSIHREKRLTKGMRAERLAAVIAGDPDEPWSIWVETDYDAAAAVEALSGAVEVHGSMPIDHKEELLNAFTLGQIKRLVTKPAIAGFGLNWQHHARVAFMGLSFSYERYYQVIRRAWRFGQKRPVHAHIVCADTEETQWRTVQRKSANHDAMKAEMAAAMRGAATARRSLERYRPIRDAQLPEWMTL